MPVQGLISSEATAQTAEENEQLLHEKARKRLYPGGRDEEDLKVMDRVPEPLVKYYKSTVQGNVLESMAAPENEENN